MPSSGRWAFLGLYLVGSIRQISACHALLPPTPPRPFGDISRRQSCASLSYRERMGTERQPAWTAMKHWALQSASLLRPKSGLLPNCHEKRGEPMAPSDPAGLRQVQGTRTLTPKIWRQARIKKAENPNPVHHPKYHAVPYFGAGFPLSLKELREPGASSSLEGTRCFSESCWRTVYKNTLAIKKEGDRKKGTRR